MKRIVLMGSPEFSGPAFKAILNDSSFQVVGLYCQPDKKKGRGQKLCPPHCKELALKNNIPVFQPKTLKDDTVFEEFKSLKPDIVVVAAYGRILPNRFIKFPPFKTINIHSSLLPKLRGAAPINWAIVNGDLKTGITIMNVVFKLDSGDILFQKEVDILPDENASQLHDKLSLLAGEIIVPVLKDVFDGKLKPTPQNEEEATYAPIIKKEDGKIDFSKPGKDVLNLIRGFHPWPGSFCLLNDSLFKIHKAELLPLSGDLDSFEVGELFDKKLGLIKLSDSILKLHDVQLAGKKPMSFNIFSNGIKSDEKIILK